MRAARIACAAWLCVLIAPPAHADVTVRARLARSQIIEGETTSLEVIVEGAVGNVSDPRFDLPSGIEMLGFSGRMQNMSWVNGRSTASTGFRYELAGARQGSYRIGPIGVRVGGQVVQSGTVALTVVPEHRSLSETRGRGPASLLVDASPQSPVVGQPVTLRVRLVQRANLAEDPSYTPPGTPGFWADRSSQPESYYADEAGSRVLVTETRTRLYPLAAGTATIGSAAATLTIALPFAPNDPFTWLSRSAPRREVALRSDPVSVQVQRLPGGAPAEFDGAVGTFEVSWRCDRRTTPQDVPITVWMDVRGAGNLPLVRTPSLDIPEADAFSSTVQDSFGPAGSEAGRRRFQWTVLGRHPGKLMLNGPSFSWYDYAQHVYVTADLQPLEVEVLLPTRAEGADASGFPLVFVEHPLDPFPHPARPWSAALAGVLAGAGVLGIRRERVRRRRAEAPDPTWMEGLKHARGASFLTAADRAIQALEQRGENVTDMRRRVESARFGGVAVDEGSLRRGLFQRFARASDGGKGPPWLIPLSIGAIVAGLAIALLAVPRPGDERMVQRAQSADRLAREGDVDGASAEWRALWRAGSRSAGLAARLAWTAMNAGRLAEASAWAGRGWALGGQPRERSLVWVTHQIRDAGGLEGFTPGRLPVGTLEWAILALLLGLAAGWAPRRVAMGLMTAAVLCAAIPPAEHWVASHTPRAVTRQPIELEGAGVELSAGQMVVIKERTGGRAWVRAGNGVEGWLPAGGLIPVGRTP
jgi:hypothetical protein